jgi:hypothetical protein
MSKKIKRISHVDLLKQSLMAIVNEDEHHYNNLYSDQIKPVSGADQTGKTEGSDKEPLWFSPKEIIVHIKWRGPFKPQAEDLYPSGSAAGLYQVYGTYHSFSSPCLLYIGRTDRSIGERIAEHGWLLGYDYTRQISDCENIQLYFGELYTENLTDNKSDLIRKCESLLIFSHKPIFNISDKNNIPSNSGLRIFNWNEHRNLMPEVSEIRWSGEYWDNARDAKLLPVS